MIEGANLAAYRHGLRIGVVVSIEGGSEEVGKAVAMQVAAFNPLAVNEADVPVDILAREKKDIIEAKAKESGKPEAVIEKMITGGLQKYLNEVTLVNQPYVMDNDKKKLVMF